MRSLPIAVCLLAGCSVPSLSRTTGGIEVPGDEAALVNAEQEWSAAVLRHDPAVVSRLLADDYVGIDGRGIVSTKDDEVREAAPAPAGSAPDWTITGEEVVDLSVRLYGDIAVVHGRVIEQVQEKDKKGTVQYRRTTVWARRDGRWQCVAFHGSRILDTSK